MAIEIYNLSGVDRKNFLAYGYRPGTARRETPIQLVDDGHHMLLVYNDDLEKEIRVKNKLRLLMVTNDDHELGFTEQVNREMMGLEDLGCEMVNIQVCENSGDPTAYVTYREPL